MNQPSATPLAPQDGAERHVGGLGIALLGSYILVVPMVLAYLVVVLWPPAGTLAAPSRDVGIGPVTFTVNAETTLILLVILTGALGSYIHMATSFADYVGNRQLYHSWVWWYILRPFIGLALALVVYFVARTGFFSPGAGTEAINFFGIIAMSSMSGMFTGKATDKLSDVFDVLFKGIERRADALVARVPVIVRVDPPIAKVGYDYSFTVYGNNFSQNGSVIKYDAKAISTQFTSRTQLTARIPASQIGSPGGHQITVFAPGLEGGESNSLEVVVEP